eukprot:COSAG02_NODE_18686_length_925_cov_0.820823_1_plen_35_part_01
MSKHFGPFAEQLARVCAPVGHKLRLIDRLSISLLI